MKSNKFQQRLQNRSVSAEKRCGSGVSTPFSPMVPTYRKGMTNFHLSFPQTFLHLFYICFTFALLVSLFVGFVLHPLSESLLFTNLIISSSSQNSWYPYSYSISFCLVPGPAPDSAFHIFFVCVHFTPD